MRYIKAILISLFILPVLGIAQDSAFLESWYWGEDGHQYYILNKQLVEVYSSNGSTLFAYPKRGVLVRINSDNLISFIVDPLWNRIVYSNYYDTWIKAFGEYGGAANQFKHPSDIASDGLGNMYVADKNNGRIVHLQYNETAQEIAPSYFQTIGGQYLERPVTLDVDDRGNTDPGDDIIWVVDAAQGKIYPFSTSGGIVNNRPITFLTNPATGQSYNDLTSLNGIAIRKVGNGGAGVNSTSNRRLYLLDWQRHKLILTEADALENGSAVIYREKNFNSNVELLDVTSDYYGDVWIVDRAGGKLYKYTWDLEYLDTQAGLNRPTGVASTRRHHTNIAITEQWTNTTGNRTYQHGARVRGLSVNTSQTTAACDWRLVNFAYLTAKVFKNGNYLTTLYDSWNGGNNPSLTSSGNMNQTYKPPFLADHSGLYTLQVLARSIDSPSEIFHIATREFTFKPLVGLYGPGQLRYKERGEWEAQVDGGNGAISYIWQRRYEGESNWTQVSTDQTFSQVMTTRGFYLRVNIERSGETDQDQVFVAYDDAPSLSKPSGSEAIQDLPTSYFVHRNYPNPFNAQTTIYFGLPEEAPVSIKVFDLRGKLVQTLVDKKLSPGYYDYIWISGNLPSGVYFISFQTADYSRLVKAVIIK